MKKNSFLLLVFVGIAIILCIGLACLLQQQPKSVAEQHSGAQTLLNRNADEVLTVKVTDGERQILASRNGSGTLVLPSLEGLPVDQEKVDALAKYSALLRSQKTLENAQDNLEDYGLDEQAATHVQAKFEDEKMIEFWIGDEVPGASTPSNYVLYEQSVCIMFQLHVSPFLKYEEDFIRTTITPSNDDSSYVTLLLSVKQAQWDAPISVAFQNTVATNSGQLLASYAITSPAYYDMTYHERGTQFLQSIYSLQAEACFLHPDQQKLEECGLLQPHIVLQAVYIDQTGVQTKLQLMASEADENGLAYVIVSGVDLIYQMNVSAYSWYSITLEDILGRQIVMPSVKSLSGLQIETPEVSLHVDITVDENDELCIDTDGEKQYEVSEFKKLYEVLISAEIDSLCMQAEETPFLLKVTYEAVDGTVQTVWFCEGPVRQAYVWKNGKPYGFIRNSYISIMQEAIQKFLNNETITVTY